MVLGLGLTLVSSLLEEDAMQRYKNFQGGLGGLALILFIVSLVMLFYKRKKLRPRKLSRRVLMKPKHDRPGLLPGLRLGRWAGIA